MAHRTLMLIEVLGSEPFTGDLADLSNAVTDGDYSGIVLMQQDEQVTDEFAAHLLIAQGSDPGFLGLEI